MKVSNSDERAAEKSKGNWVLDWLLREGWKWIVLVPAAIVLCVIMTYIFPSLPKADIKSISFGQWVTLGLCLVFGLILGIGVVVAAVFRTHLATETKQRAEIPLTLEALKDAVKEEFQANFQRCNVIPSISQQIKTDHERTQETFNNWLRTANGVLSQAAKSTLHELWLSYPWEYMALIEKADAEYGKKSTPTGKHIESITLFGTMVGFAFLLPEAVRNHACRAKRQFQTLKLYASDARITVKGQVKHLVHYPLRLVAELVRELTQRCLSFKELFKGNHPHSLSITIDYFPHDLLNAAIYLPNHEIAVLQALDTNGLSRILEDREMQVGFRHINGSPDEEAYERFAASMGNLDAAFKEKKKEKWTLTGNANEPSINVVNPHWRYNIQTNNVTLILSPEEYAADNSPPIAASGQAALTSCIQALFHAITTQESSGNDIFALEPVVSEKKKLWERRLQMKCPCHT